jgi:hypothetical protein
MRSLACSIVWKYAFVSPGNDGASSHAPSALRVMASWSYHSRPLVLRLTMYAKPDSVAFASLVGT